MSDPLDSLNRLFAEILPANRFYAAKLGAAGRFTSLDEFTSTIPFTTKDELAADHLASPPYGTTHTYPLETYHRFHQTSGTRGRPLVWLDDPAGWSWILDNWEWVWRGAGVNPGEAAFFPFSFGPFLGFWAGFEAAARLGIRAIPGGGMSSENRLRLLEHIGPTALCCTPTYALRLAEVAEAIGLRPQTLGVRTIIVCGEPGGSLPSVRRRIESAWQARVVDHHGMTEIGPVSVGSTEDPDLLLLRHAAYFCEVIDPETSEAVAPDSGRTGELVLTTLGRFGSPLIRYRTADLVEPVTHPGHPPERFALRGGILSRTDDMHVVRGINIHPSAIDAIVRAHDGIGEYQVEVDKRAALTELRITAEADPGTAASLASSLRNTLGLRIPVTPAEPGSLPTFEVKAKRWNIKC
jgi:phenylacetate-CoA ligase